jgi:hypothetical protein
MSHGHKPTLGGRRSFIKHLTMLGAAMLGTVQLLIPGGTFHTARVSGERRWFLGASTEWPGVQPADVELGNAETLAAKYPKVAAA